LQIVFKEFLLNFVMFLVFRRMDSHRILFLVFNLLNVFHLFQGYELRNTKALWKHTYNITLYRTWKMEPRKNYIVQAW
jgi:hypothetical protein